MCAYLGGLEITILNIGFWGQRFVGRSLCRGRGVCAVVDLSHGFGPSTCESHMVCGKMSL